MGNQRIKFDFLVHDLKVPLAVIEAGVSTLLQKTEKYGPLTEKQEKVLRRVLRNTLVTKALVNDALELGRSRKGILNKTMISLSRFVEDTMVEIFDLTDSSAAENIKGCTELGLFKETLSEKGIFLEIDEALWCRSILMDESKIRQILRNLLNNALKYRNEKIRLCIEDKEACLFISVSDDGVGIPADFHEKIFQCYFQMDVEQHHCVRGHGLGLAGVMVLLEDMGGKLYLNSDTGKGATFSVMIPM
ncbi:MAG: HAMP domain-containing sensor histidine kinase [Pseudomonadota bacterium]